MPHLPGYPHQVLASRQHHQRIGVARLVRLPVSHPTRAGDEVYVHSIDRLARNTVDLLRLVESITDERGASIQFVKEGLRFTEGKADHQAELMMTMLGAFAKFERAMNRAASKQWTPFSIPVRS